MRAFLETFQHCPACGDPGVQRNDRRVCCGGCGHQFYLNPAVAVGVLPELADGRFLWIRRAKDPGKGRLAIPGGFVDPGETAEVSARREIEEELGLALDRLHYITSAPNVYRYAGVVYDVLDFFFHAKLTADARWTPAEEEVSAIELLAPHEVAAEALAFDSMRTAWQTFLRHRRTP